LAALRDEPMIDVVGVKPDEEERACRSRAAARAVTERRFVMFDYYNVYCTIAWSCRCFRSLRRQRAADLR